MSFVEKSRFLLYLIFPIAITAYIFGWPGFIVIVLVDLLMVFLANLFIWSSQIIYLTIRVCGLSIITIWAALMIYVALISLVTPIPLLCSVLYLVACFYLYA